VTTAEMLGAEGEAHGKVRVFADVQRLAAEGVIGRPAAAQRPLASGQSRPRPRRPVADVVPEQRR
jgi:hypothetical protein